MALEPAQNDSIISVGLDVAEETEKAGGEIAAGVGQEVMPAAEANMSTPDQDAALREAQELAQAAREQEAAERAQEMERAQEYER